MRITAEILQKQWNSINYYSGGFLRIDTEHPLEWYIGYLSIRQKAFLLISDEDMGNVDSSKSMAVRRGRRESDNRWSLTFELLREEQQGVFINLCCDIIEYSRSAANSKEALELVIKRYKQWNRLLEYQRKGLLDEGMRKGLIGELIFLRQRIEIGAVELNAVQGWTGPEGGDQDFVYSDGWHEIKTLALSSTTVSISSLEQLDSADEGKLVIMRVDKCAPEKNGAFSLNDIVRSVSNLLRDDPEASALFELKLSKYGYIDLPDYSEQKYFYFGCHKYFVDSSFPRLTRVSLPVQIAEAQYSLSILGLKNWEK